MQKKLLIIFICIIISYLTISTNTNVYCRDARSGASGDYRSLITDVIVLKRDNAMYARLVIGGFLVVADIKLYKDGTYEFPLYKSSYGQEYQQLEIIDEKLQKEVKKAIRTNRAHKKLFTKKVNFQIVKREKLTGKHRKANIKILFNDSFIVTVGLMKSKNRFWIAWPATKHKNGKFRKNIYILNKKLKQKIEQTIIKTYKDNN